MQSHLNLQTNSPHSCSSLFVLFFPSRWDNFSSKPKDIYVSVILQCVQVNQAIQPHMSVFQEKIKSAGFPVAIQNIRISSKFITMTGEKKRWPRTARIHLGQSFHMWEGNLICLSLLEIACKYRCICTKIYGHFNQLIMWFIWKLFIVGHPKCTCDFHTL